MTERERLQYCYELAFYPPRLNEVWRAVQTGVVKEVEELGRCLDTAMLLHRALPEGGYASQRALVRLASYQAASRAFGTVRFLRNLRKALGRSTDVANEVPGHLVRDIGLPPLDHHALPAHKPHGPVREKPQTPFLTPVQVSHGVCPRPCGR